MVLIILKMKKKVRTYCLSFSALSSRTGASLQERGENVVVEEEGRGGTTIALLHHKARRTNLFVRPAMMASSEVVILIGPLAQLSLSINSS